MKGVVGGAGEWSLRTMRWFLAQLSALELFPVPSCPSVWWSQLL
jgi:hypothetical protein